MVYEENQTIDHARRLFAYAQGFRVSADKLIFSLVEESGATSGTIAGNDFAKLGPLGVAGMLSAIHLELLLKTLLILDNGRYPRIHPLLDLFNELKDGTKARIRKLYSEIAPQDTSISSVKPNADLSLEGVLRASENAFVNLRYLPAHQFTDMEGFIASNVTDAAMKILYEDHADFFTT